MIKYLFFTILICNLNSFASFNRLTPLIRTINTKTTKSFAMYMKSASGDESQKLAHIQKLMKNEIAILELDPKEYHKLLNDIAQVKTYLEKVAMCEKSISELCQQQFLKTIEPLSPEIKTLIIEKIKNDYSNMSEEELAESIKNIQAFQEEIIKKSEKILSIILPLGIGLVTIIPTVVATDWCIYIIDLISG